jgi:STE24 endopeptidase
MKCILLVCFLLFSCACFSQQAKDDSASTGIIAKEQFDANVAAQSYISALSPGKKAQSDAYFEGGYWIQLWGFVLDILTAWIFLSLGLSKWIKRIASRAKKVNMRNLIYIVMYLFLSVLILFPFSVYTDFVREKNYGLSNLTFGGWLSEDLLQTCLFIVFGSLLVTILYIVMRKVTGQWWIWGSGVIIIFLIISIFIAPVFISPLFNDYTPLENGPVRDEILSLARANGVPATNVYQFNASKQSSRISANVSGIGSTIRVSLNDNLLNKCTPSEIKSVMAHELGHYVLNHTYKLLIYLGVFIIAGLALINLVMKKAISRFGKRWGIESISDIGSLPLFVVLFSFYLFITTPVTNSISRTTESEADIFGLNAAREPDGFASVAMKVSDYRKIDPAPLEEILFYDHPSGKTRILMAMKWKQENLTSKQANNK